MADLDDLLDQDAPASAPSESEFAWPAKPSVLGTRVKRLDGPDKVTGRANYTFDRQLQSTMRLYATLAKQAAPASPQSPTEAGA